MSVDKNMTAHTLSCMCPVVIDTNIFVSALWPDLRMLTPHDRLKELP
jgi:hypothetical protein